MSRAFRHCRNPRRACRAFVKLAQYPGTVPGFVARLSAFVSIAAACAALGG